MRKRLQIFLFLSSCTFLSGLSGQSVNCLLSLYPDLDNSRRTGIIASADTLEVKSLWNSWRDFIFYKPDSAYSIAKTALYISFRIDYQPGVAGSLLRMGNAWQYQGQYEKAEDHIRCAIVLEQQYGTPRTQAIALSDLGIVLYNMGSNDSALHYLDQSLATAQSNGLVRQEAQALQNKARVYNSLGYHKLAVDCNLASLRIFESLDRLEMVASGYNTLGATYVYAGEMQKAAAQFKKSAAISSTLGENEMRFTAEALSNTGFCYQELMLPDSALKYYRSSVVLAKKSADAIGVLLSNAGIASALSMTGKHSEAIALFEQVMIGHDTLEANPYLRNNQIKMGQVYRRSGDLQAAARIFNEMERAAPITGQLRESFLEARYELATASKNESQAFNYFLELTSIRDTLAERTKIAELEELAIIYDLEKREKEIEILQERRAKDQWRLSTLLLGLISAISLGTLLIIYQRRRARKRRERDAKRIARMSEETERLSDEVKAKDREITAQSVLTAKQQEELIYLKSSLQELSSQKEVTPHEFNRLIRQVDSQLSQEHGWERVLETFKEVQPGFIEGLAAEFPELTSSDLRLAALMRMNLGSKTIAELVHISPDSVKRARNRFRQKINIDKDTRLQDWIMRRQV